MTDLYETLERLGLSQYLERFVAEGFDTWDTVLDITESDLNSLNVKLGHRRKLQRAIAESRAQSKDRVLPIARAPASAVEDPYKSDDSASETKSLKKGVDSGVPPVAGGSTKRKYRRHPKPDENAPERPASAYVIFSNQMREKLKGQELSFTEIAKIVGERWQVLEIEEKSKCERQAATAKEKYLAELAEYKKTAEYAQYQDYLIEFKAKHAVPSSEGKRSKLETETSTSTRSSSHDNLERAAGRRVSTGPLETASGGRRRAGSTPPSAPYAWPSTRSAASKPTSPAMFSFSGINSPIARDQYSPISASPVSTAVHKSPPSELNHLSGTMSATELTDGQPEAGHNPIHPPLSQTHKGMYSLSPSAGYGAPAHGLDFSSRRTTKDSPALPPLVHEDTTLSSDGGSYIGASYHGPFPSGLDTSKPHPHRLLPQPIPTPGAGSSQFDQRLPILPPLTGQTQSPDFRHGSSMAALLRAGELARDADSSETRETDKPP